MKLYNLYQSVILEEIINLTQLNEAVSTNDIDNVLKGDPTKQGKFYHASFNYTGNNGKVSKRWVQIYQKNISTANNGLIDAYQVSVDGKYGAPSNEASSLTGWKKFRLDKISDFKVSKVPYYQEPKPYTVYDKDGKPKPKKAKLNKTGNDSPSVKSTLDISKIGSYQYVTPKQKTEPVKQQPVQKQTSIKQQQQQQSVKPNINNTEDELNKI